LTDTDWSAITPGPPAYLFTPFDQALLPEYDSGRPLTDIFPDATVGIATGRDAVAVGFDLDAVLSAGASYLAETGQGSDREALRASITRYLYRPFDCRFLAYDDRLVDRPRRAVMTHLCRGNRALYVGRQGMVTGDASWTVVFCGDQMEDYNLFRRGNNACVPLYLYPQEGASVPRDERLEQFVKAVALTDGSDQTRRQARDLFMALFPEPSYPRWPNLDPFLLADLRDRLGLCFIPDGTGDLTETFGPEDVFDYIYAILHSPTYRGRYTEFLKRDFPRIPFTSNRDLFAALAAKGRDLVALHLMESPLLDAPITSFPEPGSDKVERVAYSDNHRRVYINKTQYFDGVPKAVWDFHVGGYQVCHKWLKDRKGRKLDNNDLMHYQRIFVALNETIRLMTEIDALIPSWPLT
jgi:predicted helicase